MDVLLSTIRSGVQTACPWPSLDTLFEWVGQDGVTIFCPSRWSAWWLEQQITGRQRHPLRISVVLPEPSQLDALEQRTGSLLSGSRLAWFDRDSFADPLKAQIDDITRRFSDSCYELEMPEVTSRRYVWPVQNPCLLEQGVTRLLSTGLEIGAGLQDLLLVVPDQKAKAQWRFRLAQAGLPVWGDPGPEVMHALRGVEAMLRWCHAVRQSGGVSFSDTLVDAVCKGIWQELLSLSGVLAGNRSLTLQNLSQQPEAKRVITLLERCYLHVTGESTIIDVIRDGLDGHLMAAASDCQTLWLNMWVSHQAFSTLDEPFEARLLSIIRQQGDALWFDPAISGVRLLTAEEAQGIASPLLLVPELDTFFQINRTEAGTLDALHRLVNRSAVTVAGVCEEGLLWSEQEQLQSFIETWEIVCEPLPQADTGMNLGAKWVDSEWLTAPLSEQRPVYDENDVVTLSPSSVESFLSCRRRFFYQHVLGLKDETVKPQAAMGTLTHRILELFNRNFQHAYTLDNLIQLTKAVFEVDATNPELDALGMTRTDREYIRQLPELQRIYLEKQLIAAFQDLAEKGHLNAPFTRLWVEESLQWSDPALPGIRLRGRADLIRERPDGTLEIVDYKTTKTKYTSVRSETNMKPLLNALEPLNWEVPAPDRYKGREHQLPLYWLMSRATDMFYGRSIDTSIQLVRPPDIGQSRGCDTLTMRDGQLAEGVENLKELLRVGLKSPLKKGLQFEPQGDPVKVCGSCTYWELCERSGEDGDEWGGEDG